MSSEPTDPFRATADNIRELLRNGGYQRERNGKVLAMPKEEALLFALETAAEHDHLALVEELIADGADVTATTEPLIIACEIGHMHIARHLIEAGMDINGRGCLCGETPLMAAASCGQVVIVKYLLEHGADVNMRDTESGAKDALEWAQMGLAEPNWPDGLPRDVQCRFNEVIAILTRHLEDES